MSLTNLICITDYVVECIGARGAILLSHLKEFQSGADTMVAVRDPAPNIRLPRDKTINKNLQDDEKNALRNIHTCTHFYSGLKR
ncbi:hypothetical protein TcasGA2_TC003888 [Tribolium castaneum]|uniref:Uncharacterized protein n=1 Tax=Tribolium castaneum TaxID=7070 RepID=D6WH64_TRICA|nr:hypothetical protein TcasGA2_TC003888 [Tribolium castaneum]